MSALSADRLPHDVDETNISIMTIRRADGQGEAIKESNAVEKDIRRHDQLDDECFSFRATKDGKLFISWHGRIVTSMKGAKAQQFLEDIDGLTGRDAQLVMACATGHFKHGNERERRKL